MRRFSHYLIIFSLPQQAVWSYEEEICIDIMSCQYNGVSFMFIQHPEQSKFIPSVPGIKALKEK